MAAVQQTVPRKTAATATFRRPQCTHITVDRAYGQLTCSMCGRIPDIGWLYRCRQDQKPMQYGRLQDLASMPVPPHDKCDFYEAAAQIAEYLQMSHSVIDGIRDHEYTQDQVCKLIAQKRHLMEVIHNIESHATETSATVQFPVNIIASVGTTAATVAAQKAEQSSDIATTGDNLKPEKVFSCPFQVCHTCRPFFHDRMYASVESVLNDEVPQPSEHDPHQRPLMDPLVAMTIGLRQAPDSFERSFRSDRSVDISSQYIDDNSDDISVDWTPTSLGAESDASSEHLDSSELYPCPGPGQCPVWSRYSGCAYDAGFDDGRRAINHGYLAAQYADRLTPENSRSHLYHLFGNDTDTPGGASSTASSMSLPTPATSMLTSLLPTDDTFDVALQKQLDKHPRAKSACGGPGDERIDTPLRRQQSNDSFGSEMDVHGGVVLTEEAVRHNSPDIITRNEHGY